MKSFVCLDLSRIHHEVVKDIDATYSLIAFRDEKLSEEKLPISEKLKVLDSITLYKTEKWWAAIALVDSFGRKQIAMYVWINKGDKWRRNQKFTIHNKAEWAQVKEAVEKFVHQLG